MEENYYASYSFSPSFYVKLCQTGFIATSHFDTKNTQLLLPEMQFEYAVLEFENIHISKKVNTLLKQSHYTFSKSSRLEEVLTCIETYHEKSWLTQKYTTMLLEIYNQTFENFELASFELCNENNELIAGEVGYFIGNCYTSLSGFFKKEKQYNNWGKLQLVLLCNYLQHHQYDFWNLGHASLEYKIHLGAKVYSRVQFLEKWQESVHKNRN